MIKWQQSSLDNDEINEVEKVIKSGVIEGNGPECQEFERLLREITKAKYAIVVNNGTSALHCALQALEKYLGSKKLTCVVPTFSYLATANSVVLNGHNLKLADSLPDTWNVAAEKINKEADVLIPVDIGGLPCDYDRLKDLHGIILEDAAEAIGAKYKNVPCGSISDITTFSFHASKTVTSGEGGAITTNNSELYELMVQLRGQGNSKNKTPWEYKHDIMGYNYRMSELQAAVGVAQIRKLSKFLEQRKKLVELYKELLANEFTFQYIPENATHSNWLCAVLLKDWKLRDEMCKFLWSQGIQVRTTWAPVHMQPPYQYLRDHFPVAENLEKRIIALPLTNHTSEDDIKTVANKIKIFMGKTK